MVGVTGAQLNHVTPSNRAGSTNCTQGVGAKSGAQPQSDAAKGAQAPLPPELADLAKVWQILPENTRHQIINLAHTAITKLANP